MKAKSKTWFEQSNERLCTAIRQNRNKPGLYAIALEGRDLIWGFAPEKSRASSYNSITQQIRKQGYQGEIVFFNYLDPKKNYILKAA